MSEFLLDDAGVVREPKYRAVSKRLSFDGASTRAVDSLDGHTRPAIAVRPRTKYEQSIMNRIPERQKAGLEKPQVYGGKVYTGIGFLPSPRSVQFLDFTVGDVVKQTIQLTNVSQGFNAFKVLPAPPLFRDVLEIVYTPQSMMSAGMSCTLTIVFSPKKNEDIDTEITLQAQTGVIVIPVVCRRKRADISCTSKKVEFGAIVVAETSTKTFTLRNDGALGVKMTIGGELLDLLSVTHTSPDGVKLPFLSMEPEVNPAKATIINLKPFSSLNISIRFAPQQLVDIDSNLFLSFDNPDVDDIVVFVRAKAIDVPVFVARNNELSFHCCFYGTLYRDTVAVQNTLASAVKVTPEVPHALHGMLEFSPKFGFVQPNASFDFQVKFTPNEGLGKELNMPVRINVTDQTMPIFFQIVASMSRLGVKFDPPELQLGVCAVGGEMLQQPLKLTNCSRIGKKVGFVRVPDNITILPFPVFDLSAEETVEVQICVAPPTQGQFTQSLQLITQFDETYHITLTGHGKPKPLLFEAPMLKLPVCTVGQSSLATTLLINKSQQAQRFAFSINKSYGVEISPASGTIEKGSSVPIVVKFSATEGNVEMTLPPISDAADVVLPTAEEATKGGKAPPPKKKTKAEEEQDRKDREKMEEERRAEREKLVAERDKLIAEFQSLQPWEESDPEVESTWSRHRSLIIPCFIDGWSGKSIMLGVRCAVVKPTLCVSVAPSDAHSSHDSTEVATQTGPSASSSLHLNYGEVPADHCSKKSFVLENRGLETVALSVKRLDPFGPFQIIRPPLSNLKPRQQCEVVLQFRPTNKAVFTQDVVIHSTGSNPIVVKAIGEGLPAALSISQDKSNPHAGAADQAEIPLSMGYCPVGDKVEVPLYLSNFSPFPLHVTGSFLARTVQPFNPNGTLPFLLTPKQVVVPPNSKVEVMSTFAPQADGQFQAHCEIEFGGDRMKKTLVLDGFGCDRGLQVVFPKVYEAVAAPYRSPVTAFGDAPAAQGMSAAAPTLISLTSTEQKSVQQTIVIVNNKGSSNGDYSVEGLTDADVKNGWKIEPLKANIAPGTKANIIVTFAPTQLLMDSLPIPNVSVVSLSNVRLVVKGGTPSQDATLFVQLKGTACR
jgi:hypothetical protein